MSIEREEIPVNLEKHNFTICEDSPDNSPSSSSVNVQQPDEINTTDGAGASEIMPLMTSKMANLGSIAILHPAEESDENHAKSPMDNNENNLETPADVKDLLAKLAEQQRLIEEQRRALERKEKELRKVKIDPRSAAKGSASPIRGANDPSSFLGEVIGSHAMGLSPSLRGQKTVDVDRLQSDLMTKLTLDQALSHSAEDISPLDEEVSEQTIANLQSLFAQSSRPASHRADTWSGIIDESANPVDFRDQSTSTGPYNRHRAGIWGPSNKSSVPSVPLSSHNDLHFSSSVQQRGLSLEPSELYGGGARVWNSQGHRSFASQSLPGPPVGSDARYFGRRASYNPQAPAFVHLPSGLDRLSPSAPFSPSPVGTPLAQPSNTEFLGSAGGSGNIWSSNSQGTTSQGQTYVSTIEPLNYRRLLERSVNCNWKYIVDKIVCNNDQQASIFLQQKLKIGTVDQKHSIVDAIVAQAYQLMINRFGNFLVQRCFEHGTQEQITGISSSIRGNTVALSMDAFGCHVIQKAFDCVPEEFKATMVSELLRRIPETVIHRYACHVWQKLFELRWTGSPPQIMKYVNEALRGMWHEVALGETGSLVVQNIFENCLEDDKRPCINEVLEYIDLIAHGQFGNWCIQHVCEHGAPQDRSRAIDVVIQNAAEYSMDQYASKVVEKCLKIGGAEFLDRYLDRVCEGRPDRPRIPLIDIASDQYGNYLVQWILQHASLQHREQVASHIRKHMVSLRGSKFGSRVGMLCCNPIYSRPVQAGPPSPGLARFNRLGYR